MTATLVIVDVDGNELERMPFGPDAQVPEVGLFLPIPGSMQPGMFTMVEVQTDADDVVMITARVEPTDVRYTLICDGGPRDGSVHVGEPPDMDDDALVSGYRMDWLGPGPEGAYAVTERDGRILRLRWLSDASPGHLGPTADYGD